jgi:integrase
VRRPDTDLVFPQRARNDRAVDFDQAFLHAVRDAKIKSFRFQDLRHTAASYLAIIGATHADIAAVLGHKTFAMAKRYAQLSAHRWGGATERMTKELFG